MNQETKELFELAAKACGIEFTKYSQDGHEWIVTKTNWNPLDPAEADRIRTKLRIDVDWSIGDRVGCRVIDWKTTEYMPWQFETFFDHNNDPAAALAWATLRVAAEIGRAMG